MDYIDREQLLELINEDCKYKNPTNEYTRGCNEVCDWAIKTIKNIPIADVVPKSEVEKLQNELVIWKQNRFNLYQKLECYETARQKVAKEIFEEIEKSTINSEFEFMFVSKKYFAELKKKYTEGEK